MQVILLKTVAQLGRNGELVDVPDGYARNYLIPKSLAVLATAQRVTELRQKAEQQRAIADRDQARRRQTAERLRGSRITLEVPAAQTGSLYARVTPAMVVAALSRQGHQLDESAVVFHQPIDRIGEYSADVRLVADLPCAIMVTVIRRG